MNERKLQPIQARVKPAFVQRLEDWRRAQDEIPSKSEAIRRLIELGLAQSDHPTEAA